MKLKPHKHTHTSSFTDPVRSCTWHDSVHTHKDPKGIGSNEDTSLEQGYHNKFSSVCAFGSIQLRHCPYQVKRPFEAVKAPLAGLKSAGEEKDGKKKQKMDEAIKIKRSISSAFISGIFYILFTLKSIGGGLYAHTSLLAQLWNPNIKTVGFSFLDSWLKWYKAIYCSWLERHWLLLCMERYVLFS